MKDAVVVDLGIIPYADGQLIQRDLALHRASGELADTLLLLEHTPVITVGAGGGVENILVSQEELRKRGISLQQTERGGNITYHGPGQLVGYLIMNLQEHKKDLSWYIESLEAMLINSLSHFGLESGRVKDYTGVWVGGLKVASIGIAVKRWITRHGFALNIKTDLSNIAVINPCGLKKDMYTSIEKLLKKTMEMDTVKEIVTREWANIFKLDPTVLKYSQLTDILSRKPCSMDLIKG